MLLRATLEETLAEAEIRRLSHLYARAMDRNEPALLDRIFADDVRIEGPGFTQQGRAAARQSPAMLREMFAGTRHEIFNQTLSLDGDHAEGETYCIASHILPAAEGVTERQALIWHIRYQDRYRREGGAWRFAARRLVIDWTETRPVKIES